MSHATATLDARIWINGDSPYFPEQDTDLVARTANTGICLSGGGTRAMCAGIGQLRALRSLGLLDRIRYISAVSGGTWVSAPFLFGRADEATLLGPIKGPETLTLHGLGELSSDSLGHSATLSLRNRLWSLHGDVPDNRLWIDAVSQLMLGPQGLFNRSSPSYMAADPLTVEDIKRRNPSLGRVDFHTPRPNRPYWIGNGCIIGPQALTPLKKESPVPLEFTPLYVGSPRRLDVTFYSGDGKGHRAKVGGGYIEPFAFGGVAPAKAIDGFNAVPAPHNRFGLADAIGISSSAFAGFVEQDHIVDIGGDLSPELPIWALPPDGSAPYALGDGGIVENFGIIPLLIRGVERIVVFVNTSTRLDPKATPGEDSEWSGIEENIPALFGYRMQSTGTALQNNHVFVRGGFQPVLDQLVAARKQGDGIIATSTLTTVDNDWWGVAGGQTVEVSWVYLDRTSAWERQLHAEVLDAIKQGNHAHFFHGPLQGFPNYATMDQNALELTELTPVQVNALADLTCWTVLHNEALFRRMLG